MSVKFTAYRVSDTTGWELKPAGGKRDWMDGSPEKFAYRCLPLVMANQAGWVVTCPRSFSVNWNGKADIHSSTLTYMDGGPPSNQIKSHFGMGVITFSLPWLFRTDAGYGLWARGPTNTPKENVQALDGIIETDWAPYTFTMNWKITKPKTDVFFRQGEPIAHLMPIQLDLLEGVETELLSIDENPQLKREFFEFAAHRSGNLKKLEQGQEGSWQMDYMKGNKPDGTPVQGHRKAFKLAEFVAKPKGG
jgi:hypothetical protein